MIQSNLKWDSNTSFIYRKALSKMWVLRRMESLKVEESIILEVYLKEIRPLAEHGVAVWHSGLTLGQTRQLEKIQKVALHIILDDQKTSYQEKCQSLNLMTLAERRTELCINFAIKLAKSNLRSEFFTFLPECKRTRSKNKIVRENLTCTKRTENAPHNYLSRLLNQNSEKLLRRT